MQPSIGDFSFNVTRIRLYSERLFLRKPCLAQREPRCDEPLGVQTSNVQALVQGAGSALRLSPKAFQRQLRLSEPLRKVIGRYTYVLMTQFAQTVACNRFHVVEQRLARWLLMTADRAHADNFR